MELVQAEGLSRIELEMPDGADLLPAEPHWCKTLHTECAFLCGSLNVVGAGRNRERNRGGWSPRFAKQLDHVSRCLPIVCSGSSFAQDVDEEGVSNVPPLFRERG